MRHLSIDIETRSSEDIGKVGLYKYAQSDIETGMDIAFNRYFSTKIYLHARYDDSIEKNKHGNYFQFKELLSFGFNYKFN